MGFQNLRFFHLKNHLNSIQEMAEDLSFFNKVFLITKPLKKSPLLQRTILFVFAMLCAVYMCTICLNQISTQTKMDESVQVIERPCVKLLENPYTHYPKPQTFSRAECRCNPVRFFVIISTQRSGSGWFETLLNSHINVSSNGEIFSVKERRANVSSIVHTLDRVYNMDLLTSASKNQCSAAIGFKWMLNQGLMAHHDEIVDYFNEKGVSVLVLFRRNLLRRMVSMLANSYDRQAKVLNGTHYSHVHSIKDASTLSKYKPTINTTTLIKDLHAMEMMAAKALECFNSTRNLVLYYEDIVKDEGLNMKKVSDFLWLPGMPLTSRQVKIHRGHLSQHIENWDDVNQTLTGTAFENFLLD